MTDEILETGLKPGKPYLGTPSVVEGVIREYLGDLKDLRIRQLEDGSDTVPAMKDLARRFQAVFYGEDDRYLPYAWNRPNLLGRALVDVCGIGGEVDDAVARLAGRIARDFFRISIDFENDQIDEGELQEKLDALVSLFTKVLLGYPE